MAAEYKLALPAEADLIAELERTQRQFAQTHKTPEELPAPKAAAKRKKTTKARKKNL